MAIDYVEDYEEVTGLKREKAPTEAKVITAADEKPAAKKTTAKAETK